MAGHAGFWASTVVRDSSDEGVALARPQQEVLCIDGDGAAGDLRPSPNPLSSGIIDRSP